MRLWRMGTDGASFEAEVALVMGLSTGLAETFTLGATTSLSFGLSPKREPRAVSASDFATTAGFVASGCFVGALGVATGFFANGAFFVTGGVGAANLAKGTGISLGLPPIRVLKASRGFVLACVADRASDGSIF